MPMSPPRNSGKWSEARWKAFVVNVLRSGQRKWGPKQETIKEARVSRGKYKCSSCGKIGPATLPPLEGNKKRRYNIQADHIDPVIDPAVGWVDWNTYIERLFCEKDNFQALCWGCHDKKTKAEKEVAKRRKK